MRGLTGKAIVVTGADAGIGRAVAIQVACAGGRVVVNDVQRPRVDDVVGGIRAAGGVAVPDYGSASEWENGTALVDKWASQFERIDGPVNNAAIRPVRDPWDEGRDRRVDPRCGRGQPCWRGQLCDQCHDDHARARVRI